VAIDAGLSEAHEHVFELFFAVDALAVSQLQPREQHPDVPLAGEDDAWGDMQRRDAES